MQRINLKELYFNANKFYENKDYEKAKALYLKIKEFNPMHPQTNNNLGLTYKNLNEMGKAINCFKLAVKSEDKYIIAINNLAKTLQEIDRIDESISYFEKSLKLDPNKKETYKEYALTLFKNNQHNKALKYLNKGIGTINFSQTNFSMVSNI